MVLFVVIYRTSIFPELFRQIIMNIEEIKHGKNYTYYIVNMMNFRRII